MRRNTVVTLRHPKIVATLDDEQKHLLQVSQGLSHFFSQYFADLNLYLTVNCTNFSYLLFKLNRLIKSFSLSLIQLVKCTMITIHTRTSSTKSNFYHRKKRLAKLTSETKKSIISFEHFHKFHFATGINRKQFRRIQFTDKIA